MKKVFSLFIALVVSLSAAVSTFAKAPDVCSPWAANDVFMARNAYGLGDDSAYSNFGGALTSDVLSAVLNSFAEDFGAAVELPEIKDPSAVTRGELAAALFGVIARLVPTERITADAYFVRNGLLNGKSDGGLHMNDVSTVEEALVLSTRVFEHIARKLGLDSKGMFWKATGEHNTVYILGSIHIADGFLYPLSENIETAFKSAKNLVVEVDMSNISAEDEEYINSIQFITDGTTIADYLSPEVYAVYAAICQALQLPASLYDYIKPWVAANALTALLMAGEGDLETAQALGLETYFLNRAAGKNILEIESARYQIDLMDSFSPALQEAQLAQLLNEIINAADGAAEAAEASDENAEREAMLRIINFWKAGDDKGLTEYMGLDAITESVDPLTDEYNKKIWIDRNKAMAETVMGYLDAKTANGDYFVLVGSGHVIGKTGIAQVLIDNGYEVERVK